MKNYLVNDSLFDESAEIEESELIDGQHYAEIVARLEPLGNGLFRLVSDRYRLNYVSAPSETRESILEDTLRILRTIPKGRFCKPADLTMNLF